MGSCYCTRAVQTTGGIGDFEPRSQAHPRVRTVVSVPIIQKEGLSCGSWNLEEAGLLQEMTEETEREERKSPECPLLLPSSIPPVPTIAHI